jgi:hypothetical protein
MTELFQASRQWSTRPPEERFTSLTEMQAHLDTLRSNSRAAVVSSRKLGAIPTDDNQGIMIEGPNGNAVAPSNWAFNQLANLGGAPASYLRTLPAPLAADCLNFGLKVEREAMDTGVLLTRTQQGVELRAATGPRYGRIWNADIVRSLRDRFGDGVTGDWRVPGQFGVALSEVTKANTTLFAGDRDCFIFLADEQNRIELPNRRDGQTGQLARGFFVSNSEVGAGALRIKTFLFDFVCANRIVWGAHELQEVCIRHTASAPDRFIEEAAPVLLAYSNAAASSVSDVLRSAQAAKIEKVDAFLSTRFGPRIAERVKAVHVEEEGRPVETIWDAITGATAYARSIPWQADRVEFETKAGELLDLVA